ncbi:MAG: hypothetical protein AAB693_00345, partial [Patescibacteria group bacterium]
WTLKLDFFWIEVRVGKEDVLYVTYTACDQGLRIALTSIKIEDFLNQKWNWKKPILISPPNANNKNWVIFPEKINGKYAILHRIYPEIFIDYIDSLSEFNGVKFIENTSSDHGGLGYFNKNFKKKENWEKRIKGAGSPPIKTKYGWLLFYHGIDDEGGKYKVGAMLLDLKNPTKILHRAKKPVFEPETHYELNGNKSGMTYVSGAVVKDGLLFLYYGGADSYVCVAYAHFEEFVEALVRENSPKLKIKTKFGKIKKC